MITMIRNSSYLLREVAGTLVLVPVGEATREFPGMITVNATSAYLWEQLSTCQTKDSLVAALLSRYEVTEQQAEEDVEKFLKTLLLVGAVTE